MLLVVVNVAVIGMIVLFLVGRRRVRGELEMERDGM